MKHSALRPAYLFVAFVLLCSACGYRVAGRTSPVFPPTVRTIAVAPFQNQTYQFKIEQNLTSAVIHELLARTSYRVQSGTEDSDATIQGIVTSMSSGPIVFDPNSGRTTKVLMSVSVRVSVIDSKTGQPIRTSADLMFREPYEVSTDAATYFAEDSPAMARLSRDIAASLVSSMIHGF